MIRGTAHDTRPRPRSRITPQINMTRNAKPLSLKSTCRRACAVGGSGVPFTWNSLMVSSKVPDAHMWKHTPGRTRPARPLLCLAEALETQHSRSMGIMLASSNRFSGKLGVKGGEKGSIPRTAICLTPHTQLGVCLFCASSSVRNPESSQAAIPMQWSDHPWPMTRIKKTFLGLLSRITHPHQSSRDSLA